MASASSLRIADDDDGAIRRLCELLGDAFQAGAKAGLRSSSSDHKQVVGLYALGYPSDHILAHVQRPEPTGPTGGGDPVEGTSASGSTHTDRITQCPVGAV